MERRIASNREGIVAAARLLVSKGGLREARMEAVASEAGLSTGALYRYFPSKADLFVDVLNAAVDREIVILDGIVDGPGSARERLNDAVACFVRRALRGPNLAYAFIAEPTEADEDEARILQERIDCLQACCFCSVLDERDKSSGRSDDASSGADGPPPAKQRRCEISVLSQTMEFCHIDIIIHNNVGSMIID